jgi:predicted lipoprotein with Yx(FWY)xxD motif
MKKTLLAMAIISVFGIPACSDDDDAPYEPPKPPKKVIALREHPTLGKILVDSDNRTLYFFANDANGQNTCAGPCETRWLPFHADDLKQDQLADGLEIADFKTITTGANAKQLTYKGSPLYYFTPLQTGDDRREAPGETGGEGGAGGLFFVAKPDYTIMLANAQLTGLDTKNYDSTYKEGTGKTLYFSDGKGVTLYTFTKDSSNNNNFTKPDFSNNNIWPIYETDKVVAPSVLDRSLFGSITVFGKKQLTFKGWPLYFFGQDNQVRGSNKGVSVPQPGVFPVPVKSIVPAP